LLLKKISDIFLLRQHYKTATNINSHTNISFDQLISCNHKKIDFNFYRSILKEHQKHISPFYNILCYLMIIQKHRSKKINNIPCF